MGVEFKLYLIPRDNTFRPDAATVDRLAQKLMSLGFAGGLRSIELGADGYTEGVLATYDHPEMIARWDIADHHAQRLTHPVIPELMHGKDQGAYYKLELHFAADFVVSANESVDPLSATCVCGAELDYNPPFETDIFYASRIKRVCDACGEAFRPQDHVAYTRDPMTGAEGELSGGLTYRFAVVVDCGKAWVQQESETPRAAPAFVAACEEALGTPLYEVPYFY